MADAGNDVEEIIRSFINLLSEIIYEEDEMKMKVYQDYFKVKTPTEIFARFHGYIKDVGPILFPMAARNPIDFKLVFDYSPELFFLAYKYLPDSDFQILMRGCEKFNLDDLMKNFDSENVNLPNEDTGLTPLMVASEKGLLDLVGFFIESGAKLDLQKDNDGNGRYCIDAK